MKAQYPVTIPWGAITNVHFGHGVNNPGPPLSTGYSDFTYSPDSCIGPGSYTVVNKTTCPGIPELKSDAGQIFLGIIPFAADTGYMMLASAAASPSAKILYADTLKNLCGDVSYLFWAAMKSLVSSSCYYPNMSMNIETTSGQIIHSFQTGNIGGLPENFAYYPGSWPFPPPAMVVFPRYYGFFLHYRQA